MSRATKVVLATVSVLAAVVFGASTLPAGWVSWNATEGSRASATAPIGSRTLITAEPGVSLTTIQSADGPKDLDWIAGASGVWVDVPLASEPGRFEVALNGQGCSGGKCEVPVTLKVDLTVAPITSASPSSLTGFVSPSRDRISASEVVGLGYRVLVDEATIVLRESDRSGAAAADVAQRIDASVAGGYSDLGIIQLRWNGPRDVASQLELLAGDPRVESAEAGLLVELASASLASQDPSDDEAAFKEDPKEAWHLELINAPGAWGLGATGKGVTIGILEDWAGGVPPHEDLPEPVYRNNTYPEKNAATVQTLLDHATHVAGLACAQDNGRGVLGVAFGCDLALRSIMEDTTIDDARLLYLGDALARLRELLDAGSRVVNASWGADAKCIDDVSGRCGTEGLVRMKKVLASLRQGPTSAFGEVMRTVGNATVLTISAGNDGLPIANNPWSALAADQGIANVVTVGSVDPDGELSGFSNYGSYVDVAAPGGAGDCVEPNEEKKRCGLLSTVPNSEYAKMEGTSMAAPLVAGVAALATEVAPDATGATIADCIRNESQLQILIRNDVKTGFGLLRSGNQEEYPGDFEPLRLVDAQGAVNCAKLGPPGGNVGGEGNASAVPVASDGCVVDVDGQQIAQADEGFGGVCYELQGLSPDLDGDGRSDRVFVMDAWDFQLLANRLEDDEGLWAHPLYLQVTLADGRSFSGLIPWADLGGEPIKMESLVESFGDFDGVPGDELWFMGGVGANTVTLSPVTLRESGLAFLPSAPGVEVEPLQLFGLPQSDRLGSGWSSGGGLAYSSGFGCLSPGTAMVWGVGSEGDSFSDFGWSTQTLRWEEAAWSLEKSEEGVTTADDATAVSIPGTESVSRPGVNGQCFRWNNPDGLLQ